MARLTLKRLRESRDDIERLASLVHDAFNSARRVDRAVRLGAKPRVLLPLLERVMFELRQARARAIMIDDGGGNVPQDDTVHGDAN